ncbi:MAG TPA: N-acetylmuramoyl-L-alanine amidase [Candidatus Didemnitutus sp.]|nr:N-acetylmuramoyl-L-alanine amidase [Candidatus Didemnitutus sp.]
MPGDEIIVAGQGFHTGTRVVTWLERDGYNGYKVPIPPKAASKPGAKKSKEPPPPKGPFYNERRVAPNGAAVSPDVAGLRATIDQFVLHYDECGVSKLCFETLQQRGLSVHFLLDIDGTIYQTLDLRERAWHATTSNDRSIGIEIANVGAYPPGKAQVLSDWYQRKAGGQVRLRIPPDVRDPRIRTPNFVARPIRPELVRGQIRGHDLVQYDYTPEQYAALIKLTAALAQVFPKIRLDCPRDAAGRVVMQKLPDDALAKFSGVLGHFHIQDNKIDPGPAFQWDLLINGARKVGKSN